MSVIHLNDSVHWYMGELTARIVAESGIPTDRFHIGKIVMHCFREDPDLVAQIDGGAGKSETAGSLLKRSIRCAISFKKQGLKRGDVMVLMAPNHLDLAVPFYAALYLGIIIAPVDRTLTASELEFAFLKLKPKIIFCQNVKVADVREALTILESDGKIVTFDEGDGDISFPEFLLEADDDAIKDFKPEEFNAEECIGFLVPTSGTTGFPKAAAVTYKGWMITGPYLWVRCTKFPAPTTMALMLSPLQWLTAIVHFVISPFMKYTRLHTSHTVTEAHVRQLITTYKPTFAAVSTTMMAQLLKPAENGDPPCDISCFDMILIGGSAVHKEIIDEVKKAAPNVTVVNAFGLTELTTTAFQGDAPAGACGKPVGIYQYRLVDVDTNEDITEPNRQGELWLKGPGMFKEYYNNPEATREAFAEGGWFKTGDLFYRDEYWNYYFVERIKTLLKYKHFQISPVEIESVIRRHPGVMDVVVTSIPDSEAGDLPVACVLPRLGHSPTAQEIKDLVKGVLSDAKQLRGGVVFMKQFPVTASTKLHRQKLREMVQKMELE